MTRHRPIAFAVAVLVLLAGCDAPSQFVSRDGTAEEAGSRICCACQYDENPECQELTDEESCHLNTNSETGTHDCVWQTNVRPEGECITRFESDCDLWASAPEQEACEATAVGTSAVDPTLELTDCREFRYLHAGHGPNCPQMVQRARFCVENLRDCENFQLRTNSCSPFADFRDTWRQMTNLQRDLRGSMCAGQELQITGNQTSSGRQCTSEMTFTITSRGPVTTDVAPCAPEGEPGFCYRDGESGSCKLPDGTVTEKVCCCPPGETGAIDRPSCLWIIDARECSECHHLWASGPMCGDAGTVRWCDQQRNIQSHPCSVDAGGCVQNPILCGRQRGCCAERVCCSFLQESGAYDYHRMSSDACYGQSGEIVPDDNCPPDVCCSFLLQPSGGFAYQLLSEQVCSDNSGEVVDLSICNVEVPVNVCCSFYDPESGLYDYQPGTRADCAEHSGEEVPVDQCEDVCCQLGDDQTGVEYWWTVRGDCSQQTGQEVELSWCG